MQPVRTVNPPEPAPVAVASLATGANPRRAGCGRRTGFAGQRWRWLPVMALWVVNPFLAMNAQSPPASTNAPTQLATFGGGCFWCLEAVFERFAGVLAVTSGYAGGHTDNPTYKQVCEGNTGHAEVVQIKFDPTRITYEQLLDIFWEVHDPTTRDRQGPDEGKQYRSIILYHDETERQAAEKWKAAAAARFKDPIVTQIVPLKQFYPAEGYHQDFYRNNPRYPYCAAVITPKLKKLEQAGVLHERDARAPGPAPAQTTP